VRARRRPGATSSVDTKAPDPVVVGYVRVSTLTQVTEGDGLGVQRDRIRGWCAYQCLPAAHIEEDAAASGASTDNRPGLHHALRAVFEAGAGAILVVYKLDRLGRNAIDVQEVLAALLDSGVRVVSLADGVDSASGMGGALLKLLTSILATFAELEKETIRTRLLEGRRRADATDRAYAVEPRYGRHAAGDGSNALVRAPDEERAIARIRALRTKGLSYRAICTALLEEGIRPRRAAMWSPIVVQRIATGHRASSERRSTSTRTARVRAEILAATPKHDDGSEAA
jgi:DNA invertase Pin-like site-specific DNA recombinase